MVKTTLRLFSGTSHPQLAAAIAKELKVSLSKMHISRFACNEIYAKPEETVSVAFENAHFAFCLQ
ncbi:hypothetical protein A2974_00310 [Candidatus Peregrinibacteria bacterium RIFCSPLOWO2_01_FULL_48_20]|nr:MAG: hypothetical protein A2974_00310 [Candidatus Peregrinibacteria bacterium RIFCSPLOWO2_01_FULL_48_20]